MPLTFRITDNTAEYIAAYDLKSEKLLARLSERMTALMTKLQERARKNLSDTRSTKAWVGAEGSPAATGNLSDSIKNPKATVEGTTVVGSVDWGEGVPYAKIQEYGGIKGSYPIEPIGVRGVRPHRKGTPRYFSKGVKYLLSGGEESAGLLRFVGAQDGKLLYSKEVFRKALPPRNFMGDALEGMKEEIREGLKGAIIGFTRGEY
jgi:hypothetical protein